MTQIAKQVVGGLYGLRDWVDARFPLMKIWNEHLAKYYAPKNFNFWYFFGALSLVVLVMQIVTGIWLTMNYKPRRRRRLPRSNTSCAMSVGAG